MFPERFIKRILQQRYIDSESLLKALEAESPVSIRVNNSKWRGSPLRGTPVPWCSDGFYLEKRPKYTLDPLLHAGCYYPQEASGMFLGQVFKQTVPVQDGLRILCLLYTSPSPRDGLLSRM